MSVQEDATTLEGLLPQAMTVLFQSNEDDPLRHHTVGQVRLMRTLMGGKRSASELSQSLNLSPSSLTQMASRMIAAGLVAKELDPADRRVRMLSLTAQGRSLMEKRQQTRARAAARVLSRLSPERRQALIGLIVEVASIDKKTSFALVEAAV